MGKRPLGLRMGSKRSYYERVNFLKLGFGYIPARTNVRVEIEALTALQEIATELRNPVVCAGGAKLEIHGSVPSGHYVTWEGGPTVAVHDPNWNHVVDLPVASDAFSVPSGEFEIRIDSGEQTIPPWLELQLMTRDEAIIVPDSSLL